MKTQFLAAAVVASLTLAATQTTNAGDISFAFSSLQSSRQVSTPRAKARQQVVSTRTQMIETSEPKLILGALLTDVEGGLQVTSTVPGSPASTVLKPGDVLRRITAMNQPIRSLNTMIQLDYAKQEIGPNNLAALEIIRPETGTEYVWVTFSPEGGFARFSNNAQQANARSMFYNLNDNVVSK